MCEVRGWHEPLQYELDDVLHRAGVWKPRIQDRPIKWHVPDSKRYFLKAKKLLSQQAPEAKRARRMMGIMEDREWRWESLPVVPIRKKRKKSAAHTRQQKKAEARRVSADDETEDGNRIIITCV